MSYLAEFSATCQQWYKGCLIHVKSKGTKCAIPFFLYNFLFPRKHWKLTKFQFVKYLMFREISLDTFYCICSNKSHSSLKCHAFMRSCFWYQVNSYFFDCLKMFSFGCYPRRKGGGGGGECILAYWTRQPRTPTRIPLPPTTKKSKLDLTSCAFPSCHMTHCRWQRRIYRNFSSRYVVVWRNCARVNTRLCALYIHLFNLIFLFLESNKIKVMTLDGDPELSETEESFVK